MKKQLNAHVTLLLLAVAIVLTLSACEIKIPKYLDFIKNLKPIGEAISESKPEPEQESEIDAEPKPETLSVMFSEPIEFIPSEDPLMLVTKDYPNDQSFIKMAANERDDSILSLTDYEYEEYLFNEYSAASDEGAFVSLETFDIEEIDGCPAIKSAYFLDADGVWSYNIHVTVVGDNNFDIIYSDSSIDYRWLDAFYLSSETVKVVWSDNPDVFDKCLWPLYTNPTGFSICMENDMKEEPTEDFTIMYTSEECILTALKEDFELLDELGICNGDDPLESYNEIIAEINGLEFRLDRYYNLYASYENTVDGNDYFYYVTTRKSHDAFWLMNFICPAEKQDLYFPYFEVWADSICIVEPK